MSEFDQIMAELKAIKEMLACRCSCCRGYYSGPLWQIDLSPKPPIFTSPNTANPTYTTPHTTCGFGCSHATP